MDQKEKYFSVRGSQRLDIADCGNLSLEDQAGLVELCGEGTWDSLTETSFPYRLY